MVLPHPSPTIPNPLWLSAGLIPSRPPKYNPLAPENPNVSSLVGGAAIGSSPTHPSLVGGAVIGSSPAHPKPLISDAISTSSLVKTMSSSFSPLGPPCSPSASLPSSPCCSSSLAYIPVLSEPGVSGSLLEAPVLAGLYTSFTAALSSRDWTLFAPCLHPSALTESGIARISGRSCRCCGMSAALPLPSPSTLPLLLPPTWKEDSCKVRICRSNCRRRLVLKAISCSLNVRSC